MPEKLKISLSTTLHFLASSVVNPSVPPPPPRTTPHSRCPGDCTPRDSGRVVGSAHQSETGGGRASVARAALRAGTVYICHTRTEEEYRKIFCFARIILYFPTNVCQRKKCGTITAGCCSPHLIFSFSYCLNYSSLTARGRVVARHVARTANAQVCARSRCAS